MISTDSIRRTAERARRANQQRNALSTWTVSRPNAGSTDPSTGEWSPDTAEVWTGPAFFSAAGRPSVRNRTDVALTVAGPTLRVDVDTPEFAIGDVVEAVTVDDSTLLGRSWRVTAAPADSYGVARDYPLEEVTS